MAIGALKERVPARQVELCIGVLLNRKSSGSKTVLGVASIALVLVRRRGEFRAVPVDVTRRAGQLSCYIHRIFALGLMAARALEVYVFSFQRKRAFFVGLFVEQGRFEAFLIVTGVAIGTGGTRFELPLVLVFVAVHAALECHLPVEIAIFMAFRAGRFHVFALQRELRGTVIEVFRRTIQFPAAGDVAGFASAAELGFLKATTVRVHVAALASAVHQALEKNRLPFNTRFVALFAGDSLMLTGEGEVRAAVFETWGGLPGVLLVAALAIRSLLSLVHILVAGSALPA